MDWKIRAKAVGYITLRHFSVCVRVAFMSQISVHAFQILDGAAAATLSQMGSTGSWDQDMITSDCAKLDYDTPGHQPQSGIVFVRRQNRAKIFPQQWPPRTSGCTSLGIVHDSAALKMAKSLRESPILAAPRPSSLFV